MGLDRNLRDQAGHRRIGDVDDIDRVVRDQRVALAVRLDELDVIRVAIAGALPGAELDRVIRIRGLDHVQAVLPDQICDGAEHAHVERVAGSPGGALEHAGERQMIALAFAGVMGGALELGGAHGAAIGEAHGAFAAGGAIGLEVGDATRDRVGIALRALVGAALEQLVVIDRAGERGVAIDDDL